MDITTRAPLCKPQKRRRKKPPVDHRIIKKLNGRDEPFYGRARNFLTRPTHEKAYGEPKFDGYRFKNDLQARVAEFAETFPGDECEWFKFLVDNDANKGASLPAEWQGANVGNADPGVRHKIGTDTSREALELAAEGARTEAAVRRTYGDIRSNGKIRCGPDFTHVAAANDDALPRAPTPPADVSPPPFLLLAMLMPYQPAWFIVAVGAARFSGAFFCIEPDRATAGGGILSTRPFTESEILSDDAIDGSKARDRRQKPKPEAHVFLKDDEIDELVRRAKNGNPSARDRLILAARPLLARIASKYASIHVPADELITQGIIGTPGVNGEITNGIFYALDKFPDNGGKFFPFIVAPITWAMLKHIEQQPPHHLSLNAPVKSHGADDDNDTPATWQDFLFDNPSVDDDLELPALDCLNERERAVIAARYTDEQTLTLKELAARYEISVERVRQIEAKALAKLRAAP
jgi:RNA polymerase sigma factor (sigma-70 family)